MIMNGHKCFKGIASIKLKGFTKRIHTLFHLFILSSLTLFLYSCSNNSSEGDAKISKDIALKPKEITVAKLVLKDFNEIFKATGSLYPSNRSEIRTLVAGEIISSPVEVGDKISKGDILFKIRPTDYELRVMSAKAELNHAKAALAELIAWSRAEEIAQLKADVERATAEFKRLSREKDRMEKLYEEDVASESDWDLAYTEAESSNAKLTRVTEALKISLKGPTKEEKAVARAEVMRAEALLSEKEQKLSDSVGRAPFDGVITGKYKDKGEYVKAGDSADTIVEISTISVLEALLNVSEKYSLLVKKGDKVGISISSLGIGVDGEVFAVNSKIDPGTRTFLVKAKVENREGEIKSGVFVEGTFHAELIKNATSVPKEAVVEDEGKKYVWLVAGGKVHQTYITIGVEDGEHYQVLTALNEGDIVAVKGIGALSDGAEVKIIE